MRTLINFFLVMYLSFLIICSVFVFTFMKDEYSKIFIKHFICINHKIEKEL